MMGESVTYDLVIVANNEDIETVLSHLVWYQKNLNPNKIVIICPNVTVSKYQIDVEIPGLEIISEDSILLGLSLNSIREIIVSRGGDGHRAGWYLQQFLKMGYAFSSSTTEYLIWDADTIPLNYLNYHTSDNKCIFTMKDEFHKPYFDTLEKLLEYGKQTHHSFIAEHMLINKDRMIELISEIESNSSLYGSSFFEKILYSINKNNLSKSGFSEFETYGSFILHNYPSTYSMRRLKTARHAKIVLGVSPSESALNWFSKCYDTLSLEKWDSEIGVLKSLCQNNLFQNIVPAVIAYNVAQAVACMRFVLEKIRFII